MIVLKVGGKSLANLERYLVSDLAIISQREKIVLVHGGADEVSELANKMGKKQRFVTSPEGIRSRYTDEEDMRIYLMVMAGLLNKRTVMALQKGGIKAIGISGTDGPTLLASRKTRIIVLDERGRKVVIDGGYTGKIESVNTSLLSLLLNDGYLPVVSPVALGRDFEPLNVDSDSVASHLAINLQADCLLLLTDVEGLKVNEKVIDRIRVSEVDSLLPNLGFGMNRKILEAKRAVDSGVKEVMISPSYVNNPVLRAIGHETGTVISR